MPAATVSHDVIAFFPRAAAQAAQSRPRRPRLLVQAARAGQPGWRRERDLPRLIRGSGGAFEGRLPMEPGAALPWLRAEEDRLDAARRAATAEYDLSRHVMLLIALLHELTLVSGPVSGPVCGAVALSRAV